MSSLQRVLAAKSAASTTADSPLRVPDPSLSPAGQAIDLIDCIDEALGWAEGSLQTAVRVARSVPGRAATLGLSTSELRTVVEACFDRSDDPTVDPRALVPGLGAPLIKDLEMIAAALHAACTRSRVAGKHVMRLALLAPGVARRARAQSSEEADPENWATTDAWLAGLSERAKSHADRARDGLGGLPTQAEMLRRRLLMCTVTKRARRRAPRKATQRLRPLPKR